MSYYLHNGYIKFTTGSAGGGPTTPEFLLLESGDKLLGNDDPIGLETMDNIQLESNNCNDNLLLESGDIILLESGDKLLAEGICTSFLIMEQNRILI